ncbi:LapA family protein [Corynebacterium flavescens]|uniref:LapA family protein n=1 Tax=Corynebacterium flavescens TaxID=28028 RepID=UPI003F5172F7
MTTPDKPAENLPSDPSLRPSSDLPALASPQSGDTTPTSDHSATNTESPASYEGALEDPQLSRKEKKALQKEQEKQEHKAEKVQGSLAASTWVGLIVGFLLLILLIVFIMQNQQQVPMNFLKWSGEFPAGVAYLIFAVAGALLMALVGGLRMLELRRQVRKQAKHKRN